MRTYTLADFPASWLRENRTVAYGRNGRYVGRLDGLWNTARGFRLVITNRKGTHTTPPLPGDTEITIYPKEA